MTQTLSARRRILAVFCGGFCGTLARYFLSTAIQDWFGKGWPYDILLINLTGALLLALLTALADAALLIGPTRRLLLTTGFMGAYTTFSSLALGDILLFNKGQLLPALLYLALSLIGGICAVLLGDRLGQWLSKFLRRETGALAFPLSAERSAQLRDTQDGLLPGRQVDQVEGD
jgi:CrcB protein